MGMVFEETAWEHINLSLCLLSPGSSFSTKKYHSFDSDIAASDTHSVKLHCKRVFILEIWSEIEYEKCHQ